MLSVAIITFNEEDNIKDALESVKWADEIVVVDSFSSDRTQDICREYTDKVYSFEWNGFSEQKNKAVSHTSHPWVLVLDADERVTKELKDEVLNVVKDGYPAPIPLPCLPDRQAQEEGARGRPETTRTEMDGYYIPRKNFFSGKWIKHGGWWPDYTLRLFRKDRGIFETREVHEAVKVNGSTGYLHNPLEHYSYKDVADYLKRMQTYSTLAARELYRHGRRANLLDIIFRPPATFCRMFFLQLGVLDGFYGILLAYLYSVYTYKKYWKLRKMIKKEGRK